MKAKVKGMSQANRLLRSRAMSLYWLNRGLLWSVYFLIAGLQYLWTAAEALVSAGAVAGSIANFVFFILTLPLTTLGTDLVLLRLFRGKVASLSQAFSFYKTPKTLRKALVAVIFADISTIIANVLAFFMKKTSIMHWPDHVLLYALAVIAAVAMMVWLSLKLFLFPFLYVDNPGERLIPLVKMSFRKMRKRMWRTIGFFLQTIWWILLVAVLLLLLFYGFVANPAWQSSLLGSLINEAAGLCVYALVFPYVELAMAGYAARLMEERSK